MNENISNIPTVEWEEIETLSFVVNEKVAAQCILRMQPLKYPRFSIQFNVEIQNDDDGEPKFGHHLPVSRFVNGEVTPDFGVLDFVKSCPDQIRDLISDAIENASEIRKLHEAQSRELREKLKGKKKKTKK
ncbi:MAG: hypothetical protein HC877_18925 [Thioploca sp.]|nr:hypothetical protein [Thioploca sp.]